MEINLLENQPPEIPREIIEASEPSIPTRRPRLPFVICSIILAVGGFFVLSGLIPALSFARPQNIWREVTRLSVATERQLHGEADDRINFLLLGVGGEGHDGANLTDTMIVASLKPSTKQVAMISVPRDLTANLPGYGWRRINNINAFAEEKEKGSGATVAAEQIGTIFDTPIHYVFRIDFKGFAELIDEINGVRVYVDHGFTDASYPTDDFKYQTVSFKQGWQTMSGETALKYARSRHGNNNEGSDFARSRRQQKMIAAVGDKLFSFETLLRPSRIKAMQNVLAHHFTTNMQLWEAVRLARMASGVNTSAITMRSMDSSPGGLLTETRIEGAFVLLPRNNNWQSLIDAVHNLVPTQAHTAEVRPQKSSTAPRAPQVEIQNGTFIAGLAADTARKLSSLGFVVTTVGNAPVRNYEKTMIIDLTGGKSVESLRTLKEALGAEVSTLAPNGFAVAANTTPEFLVILGKTANAVAQGNTPLQP